MAFSPPGWDSPPHASLAAALNFVVTANGLPAIFTPLGQILADGSDIPLTGVLMIQVIGYSTPILPYQASPMVVAMQMGGVSQRDALKFTLAAAAMTFLVVAPVDYFWFRFLDWLG